MDSGATRLRKVISQPGCTIPAPIYDPLSARIAEMIGWDICKLSGSVAKGAELALPDDAAIVTLTDLVDISRRILRAADVALMVDIDDGGVGALSVYRTVRELETAGVASVEMEDNRVPSYYGQGSSRHVLLVPMDEQVGKLRAAVDARRGDMLIVARSGAFEHIPLEDFLERIVAYAETGVDAWMIPDLDHPGVDGCAIVEAIHSVTKIPIFALGLPWDKQQDAAYLEANSVRLRYTRHFPAYRMAAKAILDAFEHVRAGRDPAELADRMVPMAFLKRAPGSIARSDFWEELSRKYSPEAGEYKPINPDAFW